MIRDHDAMTRRDALKLLGGGSAALAASMAFPWLASAQRGPYELGYSLYGMRSIPHMEGLGHVARIGFPATELTLRPGWDTEPRLLTRTSRAAIRGRIDDLGLKLVSVMEGMRPGGPKENIPANVERLKAAAEVAHECSPGAPALIQSPFGGTPGTFMQIRDAMTEELSIWARELDALDVTYCIKPHSKGAMSHPEHVIWALNQVNHPRMKGVIDYGHFGALGLGLRESIGTLAPYAGFCHIKDWIGTPPNHSFLLPGDGVVDYHEFVRVMAESNYNGPIVIEVSVDVFGKPDYDPIATAEYLWRNLSPAFA